MRTVRQHSESRTAVGNKTQNFHRIRNKLGFNGNKKEGLKGPGGSWDHPKSAPLPRKNYINLNNCDHKATSARPIQEVNFNEIRHTASMKNLNNFGSNFSLNKTTFNPYQLNDDYIELRTIVRRIEEAKKINNHKVVPNHQDFYSNWDLTKSNKVRSHPSFCEVISNQRKIQEADEEAGFVIRHPHHSHRGGAGSNRSLSAGSNFNEYRHNIGVDGPSAQGVPMLPTTSSRGHSYPQQQQLQFSSHPPRNPHQSIPRGSTLNHGTNLSSPSRVSNSTNSSRLDNSPTSPATEASPNSSMDGRKSRRHSSKSPGGLTLKRSDNAPVTLQGWLFKQGSDGLMLWKKRWFVLSEFCLFYYKGPEEDKVLGSILLPSYKINPVSKDDAVFKKHSFKAEHHNMRTYYFAAETKESMKKWMNALSLASILQQDIKNSDFNSLPKSPMRSNNNQSRHQVQHHNYPIAEHQMHSSNGNAYQYQPPSRKQQQRSPMQSVPLTQEFTITEGGGRQPLYANAPQKPKRLNTSRERSPDQYEDEELSPNQNQGNHSRLVPPQHTQYPYQQAMHVQNLQQHHYQQQQQQQQQHGQLFHHPSESTPTYRHRLPQERRTPEEYGRAILRMPRRDLPDAQMKFRSPQGQFHSPTMNFPIRGSYVHQPPNHRGYPPPPVPGQPPYDPYAGPIQRSQPTNNMRMPPMSQGQNVSSRNPYSQNQLPPQQGHQQQYNANQYPPPPPQQRVPRPHSADFLEYEKRVPLPSASSNPQAQMEVKQRNTPYQDKQQPQRPKSSIDSRMLSEEYWKNAPYPSRQGENFQTPSSNSNFMPQKISNNNSNLTPNQINFSSGASQTDSQMDSNDEVSRYFPTPSPRKPMTHHEQMAYQNLPEASIFHKQRLETVTPNRLANKVNNADDTTGDFKRSASARLHRNKKSFQDSLNQTSGGPFEDSKKKEQREESMKRLLEWKQRMLQSPLTRKSSRNASRTQTPTNSSSPVPSLGNDSYFRQKVLEELEEQEVKTASERKLSRKGSGASRSSRSRSSPRFVNRTTTSSSDEESAQDSSIFARQQRKKSKVGSPTKTKTKEVSDDQPEYINITSLDLTPRDSGSDLKVQEQSSLTPRNWKKRTIGPDDWYNDDFDYSKARAFSNDPSFYQHYQILLNQRSKDKLPEQISDTFKGNPSPQMCYDVATKSSLQPQTKPKPKRHLRDEGRSVTWHADKFKDFQIMGKKGKDVLVSIGRTSPQERRKSTNVRPNDKIPWSPVKALNEIRHEKEAPPKNLVQDRLKELQTKLTSPNSDDDMFTPSKSMKGRQRSKSELPRAVEALDQSEEKSSKELIALQRKRREMFFESVLSDNSREESSLTDVSEYESPGKAANNSNGSDIDHVKNSEDRKKSVRDLLSDFEKKSRQLKQMEQDSAYDKEFYGSRRRVCSDTETMMFETSSEDDVSVHREKKPVKREDSSTTLKASEGLEEGDTLVEEDGEHPAAGPDQPHDKSPILKDTQYLDMNSTCHDRVTEGQYLPMTSSGTGSFTPITHDERRRTSLTSSTSKSSLQSLSKLGCVKDLAESQIPTELLIQTTSLDHNRTPSQSMVLEHIQNEFGPKIKMDVSPIPGHSGENLPILPLNYNGPIRPILAPSAKVNLPSESPRYCEIDEATELSHYEYLYKARSATPLHYESVVYQEIPQEQKPKTGSSKVMKREGLPDILGNAPTHRGNSSSDADDEGGSNPNSIQMPHLTDTFIPASFFLNKAQEQNDRRGSQGSLSNRELPQTPTEKRRWSSEEISKSSPHQYSDSSIRGSISSIESTNTRRRAMLQNIQEVSNTMERSESQRHGMVMGKQDMSGYPNVFDEEGELLEHISLPLSPRETYKRQKERPKSAITVPSSSKSKTPYYVSDLSRGLDDSVLTEATTLERAHAIQQLQRDMEYLDAETEAHLNHNLVSRPTPQFPDYNVVRTKSLEGLLGDSPGAARDSVQVHVMSSANPSPFPYPPLLSSPEELEPNVSKHEDANDEEWRQSLRRASAKHATPSKIGFASPNRAQLSESVIMKNSKEKAREPHINGYIWDEKTQRFYKISNPHSQPDQRISDASFLEDGLPNDEQDDSNIQSDVLGGHSGPQSALYLSSNSNAHVKSTSESIFSSPNESNQEDMGEIIRTRHQHRRRTSSAGRKDSEYFRSKLPIHQANNNVNRISNSQLMDITAQDLLGKSHEELVLLLIHLRRQSALLNDSIEASKMELRKQSNNQQLSQRIRDLEEQQLRTSPIVSLVDNMVKLGSLYRRPEDSRNKIQNSPGIMEQGHGNLQNGVQVSPKSYEKEFGLANQPHRADIQMRLFELYQIEAEFSQERFKVNSVLLGQKEMMDRPFDQVNHTVLNGNINGYEDSGNQTQIVEKELMTIRGLLEQSHQKLDENSRAHARWEHDLVFLRQQLQQSANRDMQYGIKRSAETAAIEEELAQVQMRASDLYRERNDLIRNIQILNQKGNQLNKELIRPSSAGVMGAETVSPKKLDGSTWFETDLDAEKSENRAFEVEEGQKKTTKNDDDHQHQRVYVNPSEEGKHNYENLDDGVIKIDETEQQNYTLGDISDADDRVKKFYGIIPKEKVTEIKTVRMVKRDSKERNVSKSVEFEDSNNSPPPPPPLPRGNYQNVHDFLQNGDNSSSASPVSNGASPKQSQRGQSLPRNYNFNYSNNSDLSKPNFKLGDFYYKKKNTQNKDSSERPLSAHERLFGSSRENSISPDPGISVGKYGSSGTITGTSDASGASPIMSPVFKSATAKQIIEEMGSNSNHLRQNRRHKKDKQRSHTISGGSNTGAVMDALKQHQAKIENAARSRDDLDMVTALRPKTNAPDVIKSALDTGSTGTSTKKKESGKITTNTIDNLFGVPEKILIPERYVPESDVENVTPEERQVRLKKADSIRKMLADTQATTTGDGGTSRRENIRTALNQEKKEREHLLALNQMIAQQVMEKSRMVAGRSINS